MKDVCNSSKEVDPSEEFEINGANDYLPSSMGLSFLADFKESEGFYVELVSSARFGDSDSSVQRSPCGLYFKKSCYLAVKDADPNEPQEPKDFIYYRQPVIDEERSTPKYFLIHLVSEIVSYKTNLPVLPYIEILVVSRRGKIRPTRDSPRFELSIAGLVMAMSEQAFSGRIQDHWIGQYSVGTAVSNIRIWVGSADVETQIARLNYRRFKTFAIGHGCAADCFGTTGCCFRNLSDVMFVYEMPTTTPSLRLKLRMVKRRN